MRRIMARVLIILAALSAAAFAQQGATGTFTDSRDGQTYRTVRIGNQTWMAENLNYDVPDVSTDVCYNNNPTSCNTYGRLYDWATVMGLPSTCNSNTCASQVQTRHQGICPAGWHVPSDAEWTALINFVGGESTAGTKLKYWSGWNTSGGYIPGTNDYGFSALPGGYWWSGSFFNVGGYGNWWSATEYGATRARYRYMIYDASDVYRSNLTKTCRFSLRCIQN